MTVWCLQQVTLLLTACTGVASSAGCHCHDTADSFSNTARHSAKLCSRSSSSRAKRRLSCCSLSSLCYIRGEGFRHGLPKAMSWIAQAWIWVGCANSDVVLSGMRSSNSSLLHVDSCEAVTSWTPPAPWLLGLLLPVARNGGQNKSYMHMLVTAQRQESSSVTTLSMTWWFACALLLLTAR
jgi:hypothetical protein